MTTRQFSIKGGTNYFYNNLINLFHFEDSNLKLDQKHGKTLIFTMLATLIKTSHHNGK